MEFDQIGEVLRSSEIDECSAFEEEKKCDATTDLGVLFEEINQMYTDRLRKLDELDDSVELRMKLLYMWITDLLEQNASLVETVEELEKVAVERVQLLEEKLRKSSSSVQEFMTKIQSPEGSNAMSLRAVVAHLEADIDSLLKLIHRARTEGCWDIRGLVFHQVSYWDIFSCAPPPPSAPKEGESKEIPKNDAELQKLKEEVAFWRKRAEKAETEKGRAQRNVIIALMYKTILMQWKRRTLDSYAGQEGECVMKVRWCANGSADGSMAQHQELDQARRLATERAEQIQALHHKLDSTEQRLKDVQAVLTAEVAEKHDEVIGLRHQVKQLEEDVQLANTRTQFRDEIIKSMRKEMKNIQSQRATDPSSSEVSASVHAHHRCSATAARPDLGPGITWMTPTKDVNKAAISSVSVDRGLQNDDTPAQLTNTTQSRMVAFQRKKVMNLANYFHSVHEEVKDLDRKFEEPDLRSEDCIVEDTIHLFTLVMCELMDLAEKVDKAVKETADEVRRHRDTQVHNVLNTLKVVKSQSLQTDDLLSEVAALRRQLEILQKNVQSAQEEVTKKGEVIKIMTDSARIHDSMIREREVRIQVYEKEIARNEDRIKSLTLALTDQKEKNRDLREAVMSTRLQLQELQAKETDPSVIHELS